MVTDSELEGLAAQALNMAKLDIVRKRFNFLIASFHEGEPLHRMKSVEALIVQRLGENWLNSGRTKDQGFHILRIATDILPPDALVVVTAANRFKETDKLLALPLQEQIEMLNTSHDRHHQLVQEGFLTVRDALQVVAQTRERVCLYLQDFEDGQDPGKPEAKFVSQKDFGGRLKLYSDEKKGQTTT